MGAKVAARIILELKTKIENWQEKSLLGKRHAQGIDTQHSSVDEEVRTILVALGYSHGEIMQTLTAIKKQPDGKTIGLDVESFVKESLKALGAGSVAHKL